MATRASRHRGIDDLVDVELDAGSTLALRPFLSHWTFPSLARR